MSGHQPHCVASNGDRFFLVSLEPLQNESRTLTVDPSALAYTRRIILLQSQLHPASVQNSTWTIVDSYPAASNSTAVSNELDTLVGDFASGTSDCQVDNKGNFIWISAKSAVKSANNPSLAQVSSHPTGVQYRIGADKGAQGSWSLIHTSRLPGAQGIDYIWRDDRKVSTAVFTIAEGVFVHAIGTETGLNLGLLTGNNLVQSNQTWTLDTATFGIPKAITYSNNILYILGSNKVLSLLPVSTTTTHDVATLQVKLESLATTTVKHITLANLSKDCLDAQLTNLYPTAVKDTLYLLCASSSTTIASRLFAFDGTLLKGPYELPMLEAQTNMLSFAAVSGPTAVSDSDFLFLSTTNNTFGMTTGEGLRPHTASFAIDDGIPPQNNTTSNIDQSASSNGQDSVTRGVVGIIVTVICILMIFYCRFMRKARAEKIRRIFVKNDGSTHVPPPNQEWTAVLPSPLPPTPQHYVQYVHPPLTSEQLDQAQIEMQRLQLGPTPSNITLFTSVPMAPPETASFSDDITPAVSPYFSVSTPAPTSPVLQSYPHSLHPFQGQTSSSAASASSPTSPTSSQQHFHSSYIHMVDGHGKDVSSGSIPSDISPGSPTTALLYANDPRHPGYHASSSSHASSSVHASNSAHAYYGAQHTEPSDHQEKDGKALEAFDHERAKAPLPPPPYLERATQLLNSPSAPAPPPDHDGYV